MYFRCSERRHGEKVSRSYQLVHCYRHPKTGKPTTKVIASLGDLSKLTEENREKLASSLSRVLEVDKIEKLAGEPLADVGLSEGDATALSVGSMWALLELLRQLEITQTWEGLVSDRKNGSSLAQHLTALICHRLDDPGSKLSLLRWLERVEIPKLDPDDITYQGLLRTMDVLIEHKDEIQRALANRVLTMFDTELDLVLMDLTSISVCTQQSEHELFAHGRSRDGHPERRQYTLMLVTTKDGVPVYHEVHPGNAADPALVEETMQSVRHLFPEIDRCMVVGDRAMLSEANVVALGELGFDHLLAAPMKRETWVREAIEATHDELMEKAEKAETETEEGEKVPDVITERETEDGRRVVVAYSMEIGQRQRRLRERRLDGVNDVAEDVVARLDGQKTGRGRPITDAGAFKQVLKAAIEKKSTAFYKIEMQGRDFIFEPLTEAMDYAETCDGKLAVVTDNADLTMETLHRLYKDLQEIERSFRTIKSDLKIRPTYHWTEKRVRAHVLLCVIALTVERVMRLKLKKAQSSLSPPAALEELRRLMHVTITLPDGQRRHVLANRTPRQLDIFRDLDVPPLTKKRLAKLVV